MSFAHKFVLWVMQRRGYLVRLNKRKNFFHTLLFCSKGHFRSANLTSEVTFFNEILRVAISTNACELTEKFVLRDLSDLFWSYKVKREISQGPKCTSQIWKSAVIGLRFFPLKSQTFVGQERVTNP